MKMGHDLNLEQTQKLIITPELKQAINLLQMSGLELEAYVEEKLETNPVLENNSENSLDDNRDEENNLNGKEKKEQESGEFDIDWQEYFADSSDMGANYQKYTVTNRDKDEESFESYTPLKVTLSEQLYFQLNLMNIDENLKLCCEYIIGNLDQNGYLPYSLKELSEASSFSRSKLEKALEVVQGFEPRGIAARDLKECLLLQAYEKLETDGWPNAIITVIKDHLADIAENKLNNIASKLKTSMADVQKLVDYIKTLNPKPAASYYTGEEPSYIVPEAVIKKVEDEYVIIMNDNLSPNLRISSTYKNMLLNNSKGSEEGKFLNSRLDSAKWLIKAIEQRRRTIYKVIECIVEVQRPFLDHGVSHLKPMKLSDVAEEIGAHESTVSRATANKYVQTPRGIYSLRFFFDSSSSTSVKHEIKKLIENENKKKPLSDQNIVSMLEEEGIKVSRRTVAKYRKELKIPSSSKRKRYG